MPFPVGIIADSAASAGYKNFIGDERSSASGTTLVIPTVAAIAIGDLVIVRAVGDNLSATTPTISCTDSGGNTYTAHKHQGIQATAGLGVVAAILATKATAAVPAGGTITITYSGAITHKAAIAQSFRGYENTLRNAAVSASGTGTAASSGASGSANLRDLVIGAAGIESRVLPGTDSDTTNGEWENGPTANTVWKNSATSGTDTTCCEITGQFKTVLAAGAQTYNISCANTDWVALIAIFQKTP